MGNRLITPSGVRLGLTEGQPVLGTGDFAWHNLEQIAKQTSVTAQILAASSIMTPELDPFKPHINFASSPAIGGVLGGLGAGLGTIGTSFSIAGHLGSKGAASGTVEILEQQHKCAEDVRRAVERAAPTACLTARSEREIRNAIEFSPDVRLALMKASASSASAYVQALDEIERGIRGACDSSAALHCLNTGGLQTAIGGLFQWADDAVTTLTRAYDSRSHNTVLLGDLGCPSISGLMEQSEMARAERLRVLEAASSRLRRACLQLPRVLAEFVQKWLPIDEVLSRTDRELVRELRILLSLVLDSACRLARKIRRLRRVLLGLVFVYPGDTAPWNAEARRGGPSRRGPPWTFVALSCRVKNQMLAHETESLVM